MGDQMIKPPDFEKSTTYLSLTWGSLYFISVCRVPFEKQVWREALDTLHYIHTNTKLHPGLISAPNTPQDRGWTSSSAVE